MNAPEKCPLCEWPALPKRKHHIRTEYQCGSEYYEGVTYEGRTCTERQRNALAAQVNRLKEEVEMLNREIHDLRNQ